MAKNRPNVRKLKKNEPNSQTISLFWLVAEAIHELRGISPYGDLGGTLGLRRGLKPHSILKKRLFKAQNAKKRTIIINDHFFAH